MQTTSGRCEGSVKKHTKHIFVITDNDGGEVLFYEWTPGSDSNFRQITAIVKILRKLDVEEKIKGQTKPLTKKTKKPTLLHVLRTLIVTDQDEFDQIQRLSILKKKFGTSDSNVLGTWTYAKKSALFDKKCRLYFFKLRV
jgi:hypothetical protein